MQNLISLPSLSFANTFGETLINVCYKNREFAAGKDFIPGVFKPQRRVFITSEQEPDSLNFSL